MYFGDIKKEDLPILPIDSTDDNEDAKWKSLYNMSVMGVDEPTIVRIINEYDKDYRRTNPEPNTWRRYLHSHGWDDYDLNSNYEIAPDDSLFMVNSVPGNHSSNVELHKYMNEAVPFRRLEFRKYYPQSESGNYFQPNYIHEEYPGTEEDYFNYLDSISIGNNAFKHNNTKSNPKDKERAALYQYWKSRKYER